MVTIILIYLWLKLLWMLFLFLIGYKICGWHKYEMLINMWILGFYILFPTLSSLSAIIEPLKFMVWLYLRRWHRMVTMATKKISYLLISHVIIALITSKLVWFDEAMKVRLHNNNFSFFRIIHLEFSVVKNVPFY
jgi:hypothetical protein